jgi:hypothetical protein
MNMNFRSSEELFSPDVSNREAPNPQNSHRLSCDLARTEHNRKTRMVKFNWALPSNTIAHNYNRQRSAGMGTTNTFLFKNVLRISIRSLFVQKDGRERHLTIWF